MCLQDLPLLGRAHREHRALSNRRGRPDDDGSLKFAKSHWCFRNLFTESVRRGQGVPLKSLTFSAKKKIRKRGGDVCPYSVNPKSIQIAKKRVFCQFIKETLPEAQQTQGIASLT